MKRMRKLFLSLVLVSFISLKAQSQLTASGMNYMQREAFTPYHTIADSNTVNKKWSLHKYSGLSASYSFFNGGNASVLSAPMGLQLNRRLNNNLYAFAGISAAPAYINFNRAFMNTDLNKINTGKLALYSRIEAGLMYINDQRTFSVSGSISVDRSSYPVYPYYYRAGSPAQQPLNGALK